MAIVVRGFWKAHIGVALPLSPLKVKFGAYKYYYNQPGHVTKDENENYLKDAPGCIYQLHPLGVLEIPSRCGRLRRFPGEGVAEQDGDPVAVGS